VSLAEPFIRRPVMTVVLTVAAVFFGVLAYLALPVNDLPAVDYPVIQVSCAYPGATPSTMANNVATPLERQFMQIPGLEMITSQSTQGMTSLVLQFNLSKSLGDAATDVQAAISRSTGNLPADLPSPPTFTKTNPNDQAIMYIGLISDTMTKGQLYNYAYSQLDQRISILEGVAKVDVYGTKAAIRIKADPSRLAIHQMTLDDLSAAIQQGTAYLGGGQLDSATRTFLVQPQGQLSTAADYQNLIVKVVDGAPVYLRDVAEVVESVQDERVNLHVWLRGQPPPSAVTVLAVYREAGANAIAVSKRIHDIIPELRREVPSSINIFEIYDRSESIVNSVNDVDHTLFISFILVVLVIYVFLGRATDALIPVVALPLSLLITFLAMRVLGYSLDNLSLMALTLAIGFLVDDAIVFLENTVRRIEAGEKAYEATLNSAREISFTILSMTLSLATVFLPLVFMPTLIGRVFQEFAITIIISIFASGLVSLTVTPLMCSSLLRRHEGGAQTRLEKWFNHYFARLTRAYGNSLGFFLRNRWISVVVWVACIVGTLVLFYIIPTTFLPAGDSSFSIGVFIAQEGTSPEQMHRYQDKIDNVLQNNPDIEGFFSLSGFSAGFPSNMGLTGQFLTDPSKRAPIDVFAQHLTGALMGIPGVMAFIRPNPVLDIAADATSKNQGQYAFAISGIDSDQVFDAAEKLTAKLRTYPFFLSVQPDLYRSTPSLQIGILRDQASKYGVSVAKIESLIRTAYAQNYVYLIKKPEDQYEVILEVKDNGRSVPDNLGLLYVASNSGALVPLSAVTRMKEVLGPQSINHIGSFPSVTISFNLFPGVPVGLATAVTKQAAAEIVPPNLRAEFQGDAKIFGDVVHQLIILFGLALLVMYAILAILYESYIHPLTVLSSVFVAMIGGLLALWIFKAQASLYAFIGMFVLAGIVKKNGIMIVDFAIQRENHGMSPFDAIHEASLERFRPILMTTFAALMGAVPIALGFGSDGSSRRPLGLVIVGGLIVSQLITLYVTPSIYLILDQLQGKIRHHPPTVRRDDVILPPAGPAAAAKHGAPKPGGPSLS